MTHEKFSNFFIAFNLQSVGIDEISIPLKSLTVDNFAAKVQEIIRLCGKLAECKPTTQFHRLGSDLSSASDDEDIPDPAITPAFDAEEWEKIIKNWRHVHGRFEKAKSVLLAMLVEFFFGKG